MQQLWVIIYLQVHIFNAKYPIYLMLKCDFVNSASTCKFKTHNNTHLQAQT